METVLHPDWHLWKHPESNKLYYYLVKHEGRRTYYSFNWGATWERTFQAAFNSIDQNQHGHV